MSTFTEIAEKWIRQHCAQLVDTPEPSPILNDDPAAWRDAFLQWIARACVRRDRCFGGIACLHVRFCEWTVEHSTVAPCTRQTFERLLMDAGVLIGDGYASELILIEDLEVLYGER